MNDDTVVKVDNLSKKFCMSLKRSMFYGTLDVFRSMCGIAYKTDILRKAEFWALKDINFELKKGETLGIIGHNGSGKTTLLRLITGIFPPDSGKIMVRGRIGALIAIGAGFHPHMTGRENIFLNGIILGMAKSEIVTRFDDIVEFAEIGEFIDAPVSTYSSGMRVRLGFSIAIHSNPDILLIDEVLSVGDLVFRNKSVRKLYQLRKQAKGIIFVSHNLEQVANISSRILIMDKGKIIYNGPPDKALYKYQSDADEIKQQSMDKEYKKLEKYGQHITSGDVEIIDIFAANDSGNKVLSVEEGEDINVYCIFRNKQRIGTPRLAVALRDEQNNNILWHVNIDKEIYFNNLEPGLHRLSVKFVKPALKANVYNLVFGLQDAETLEYFEKVALKGRYTIRIRGNSYSRGTVRCESIWKLDTLKKD